MGRASTVEPEAEMGVLERQMKDLGKDMEGSLSMSERSVGALSEHAKAMRSGASGTLQEAVTSRVAASGRAGAAASRGAGALAGVGSLVSGGLLMVGIGGIVGIGILQGVQKLAKHSPALSKTADMMGQAWSLFWRPFGNALSDKIFPVAEAPLQFSVNWNKWANEGGLLNAFIKGGESIGKWIVNYFKDNLSALLSGDSGDARNSGARLGALAGGAIGGLLGGPVGMALGAIAGNMVGQLTGHLIGELNGVDWRSVMSNTFGSVGGAVSDAIHDLFPDLSPGELLGALAFPPIGAGLLLSHMNWPEEGALFGVLKNRMPDWRSLMPEVPNWRNLTPRLPDWSNLNPFGGGGEEEDPPDPPAEGSREGGDEFLERHAQDVDSTPSETTSPTSGSSSSGGSSWINDKLSNDFSGGFFGFASGGIVSSPTKALVGEAGSEAIVPLDRLPRLMSEGMKSVEGSGPGMDREALTALSEVPDLLRELISAVEERGDLSVSMDGEQVARLTQDAGDRFLNRREVYK